LLVVSDGTIKSSLIVEVEPLEGFSSELDRSPALADKPAEKHCWLIYSERKILFRLKKQAEKDGL
jgi:hypothetical protein